MDRSFSLQAGSLLEFSGNVSRDMFLLDLANDRAVWQASEDGPPAYIGRAVVQDDGFFRGWLIDISSYYSAPDRIMKELPVIGRFYKGRNCRLYVILYTLEGKTCSCWIKKKLDSNKEYHGVIGCVADYGKVQYSSNNRSTGCFTFNYVQYQIADDDDREASINNVIAEYELLLKREAHLKEHADDFVKQFDSFKEFGLNLLDEYEDLDEHKIVYPLC